MIEGNPNARASIGRTEGTPERLRVDSGESSTPNKASRPLRLALYSHDAMGVGHVRRNLLIGQSLAAPPTNATSLLVCGVHEATAFTSGHGIDCLTLPSLAKHENDDYRPRDLRLPAHDVSHLRSETLKSALATYAPDVLIVDKVPRGLHGDLERVLPLLRNNGTKIVFGMRDILDCPKYIADEWSRHAYEQFILDHYDSIWVYGDRRVYDPIEQYDLRALEDMVRFTGYFDQRERIRYAEPLDSRLASLPDLDKTVLCMVGGGQDGGALAHAFAQAALPAGQRGILLAGPLMASAERREIESIVSQRDDMQILTMVKDADLLVQRVSNVICMGGYNSMLSVVSFNKRALIVPRIRPRSEQLIRAKRFAELGLVDTLDPSSLTSEALSQWIQSGSQSQSTNGKAFDIDLGGLKRLPILLAELGMESLCLESQA